MTWHQRDPVERPSAATPGSHIRRPDHPPPPAAIGIQWGLLVGLALILVAPIFLFRTLPLVDLPIHLARQHILFGGQSPFYDIHWRLVPNLALEAGVFLLHHVMTIDLAVRCVVAGTIIQLFFGVVALNQSLFGAGARLTAPAAVLFIYSGPLLFGFVNFCFGLGMAFWVVALWLRWRNRIWGTVPLSILASLILCSHLFAFAIYMVVIGACQLQAIRHQPLMNWLRSSALSLAHLAPPLAIYLMLMPSQMGMTGYFYGGWRQRLAEIAAANGLFNPIFDQACLLAVGIAVILLARSLRFASAMILPVIALGIAFLVLPDQIRDATFVAFRMPAVVALLLVASVDWRPGSGRQRRLGTRLVFGLAALQITVLYVQWHGWQEPYDAYRAAFARLPENATLLPLRPDANQFSPTEHPPIDNIAALAAADRGAFVPIVFADLPPQLLVTRPPWRHMRNDVAAPPNITDFDYVLVIHPEDFAAGQLPHFELVAGGTGFVLGRLIRN